MFFFLFLNLKETIEIREVSSLGESGGCCGSFLMIFCFVVMLDEKHLFSIHFLLIFFFLFSF